MKLLERLDRLIRPIAIPDLTIKIIVGQVLLFVGEALQPGLLSRALLVWDGVLAGEVWRLITFMIVPPATNVLFLFFFLYLFHLMGTAMEQTWGTVRYNVYFYVGYLLTLAAAGVTPSQAYAGAFLQGSVFLAFATYNPRFELRLFFVLPVQIRWLAYLQAIGYAMAFIGGTNSVRLMVAASIGNYLLFFGPMAVDKVKSLRRRREWSARQFKPGSAPRHVCATCGVDSNTDPNMDFRYCSQCGGEHAYCEDHLRNHEHVSTE